MLLVHNEKLIWINMGALALIVFSFLSSVSFRVAETFWSAKRDLANLLPPQLRLLLTVMWPFGVSSLVHLAILLVSAADVFAWVQYRTEVYKQLVAQHRRDARRRREQRRRPPEGEGICSNKFMDMERARLEKIFNCGGMLNRMEEMEQEEEFEDKVGEHKSSFLPPDVERVRQGIRERSPQSPRVEQHREETFLKTSGGFSPEAGQATEENQGQQNFGPIRRKSYLQSQSYAQYGGANRAMVVGGAGGQDGLPHREETAKRYARPLALPVQFPFPDLDGSEGESSGGDALYGGHLRARDAAESQPSPNRSGPPQPPEQSGKLGSHFDRMPSLSPAVQERAARRKVDYPLPKANVLRACLSRPNFSLHSSEFAQQPPPKQDQSSSSAPSEPFPFHVNYGANPKVSKVKGGELVFKPKEESATDKASSPLQNPLPSPSPPSSLDNSQRPPEQTRPKDASPAFRPQDVKAPSPPSTGKVQKGNVESFTIVKRIFKVAPVENGSGETQDANLAENAPVQSELKGTPSISQQPTAESNPLSSPLQAQHQATDGTQVSSSFGGPKIESQKTLTIAPPVEEKPMQIPKSLQMMSLPTSSATEKAAPEPQKSLNETASMIPPGPAPSPYEAEGGRAPQSDQGAFGSHINRKGLQALERLGHTIAAGQINVSDLPVTDPENSGELAKDSLIHTFLCRRSNLEKPVLHAFICGENAQPLQSFGNYKTDANTQEESGERTFPRAKRRRLSPNVESDEPNDMPTSAEEQSNCRCRQSQAPQASHDIMTCPHNSCQSHWRKIN